MVFKHIAEKRIDKSRTLKNRHRQVRVKVLGYCSSIIHVFIYSCFRKVTPFSMKFWRGCPSAFQFYDWTQHHHNVCTSAKLVAHPKWVENELIQNIRITLNNSITTSKVAGPTSCWKSIFSLSRPSAWGLWVINKSLFWAAHVWWTWGSPRSGVNVAVLKVKT